MPPDQRDHAIESLRDWMDADGTKLVLSTLIIVSVLPEEIFATYNHESEIYALRRYYRPENLDFVLDAGCGNGTASVPL